MPGPRRRKAAAGKETLIQFFRTQLAGESPLTFATAERLYRLATNLAALRPWEFLEDQDLILMEDPVSREICHCSIMGALGEVFSLHVYVGVESYRWFRRMAEGKPFSIGDFFASQSGVSVEFVRAAQLTAPDRQLVRAFNHPSGKGVTAPLFRALRPGYHPWYVTEGEGILLAECMQAVIAFCEALPEDAATSYWQEKDVYPFLVPIRGAGRNRDFEIKMVNAPNPPVPTPAIPALDEAWLGRIRAEKYPVRGAFELDHFYGAGRIGQANERKACFRMGMAVNADSGFAFLPEVGTPGQTTGDILMRALMKAIEGAHFLPAEVRVNQKEFQVLLAPFTEELESTVRLQKSLPALDQAKYQLLVMVGDPGPIA